MTEGKTKIGSPTMLVVLGLICACTVSALAILRPRPVEPRPISQLWLDTNQVTALLASDTEAASSLDETGTSTIVELGRRVGSGAPSTTAHEDLAELRALAAELPEETTSGLRAQAAIDLADALLGNLSADDRQLVLGDFANSLEEYGLVGREPNAPLVVARTLFKARWNILHGFPAETGFVAIEHELYWGWLALETDAAPPRRLEALAKLREYSDQDTRDVHTHLLYRAEQYRAAATAYEEAHGTTDSIRERNHALYVATLATQ